MHRKKYMGGEPGTKGEVTMKYKMTIAGLERELPLFPISDDTQIAAFILFGDVEMTEVAAGKLLEKAPEFDIIMSAEAKSIPLVHEMSKQKGINDYVIARKGIKVYMKDPISVDVLTITTQHQQKLHLGQDDVALLKGRKVLIVDDVISTGESLKAMEALAEKAGANIVGRMAVLAEGDAYNRTDISVLGQLPLFDKDGQRK